MAEEIPKSDGIEATTEQPEVVLSRDFPSTKKGYEEAKAFFTQAITSYYGKDAIGRTPDRKEIPDEDLPYLEMGYAEILSNALFHGNLEYEGKVTDAIKKDESDPIWNSKKKVGVRIELRPSGLEVTISDEGKGTFDVSKIIKRIAAIKAAPPGDPLLLEDHERGYLMIAELYYGLPAQMKVHYDEAGNKTGTTVTLTRDLSKPLELRSFPEAKDYLVIE